MAGKPKPPDERRAIKFYVQLTADEAQTIRQAADALGISYSAFLRQEGLQRARNMPLAEVDARQLKLPSASVSAPRVARRRA
jgi:hypothetical protein